MFVWAVQAQGPVCGVGVVQLDGLHGDVRRGHPHAHANGDGRPTLRPPLASSMDNHDILGSVSRNNFQPGHRSMFDMSFDHGLIRRMQFEISRPIRRQGQ